jgi:hypothetical protein
LKDGLEAMSWNEKSCHSAGDFCTLLGRRQRALLTVLILDLKPNLAKKAKGVLDRGSVARLTPWVL